MKFRYVWAVVVILAVVLAACGDASPGRSPTGANGAADTPSAATGGESGSGNGSADEGGQSGGSGATEQGETGAGEGAGSAGGGASAEVQSLLERSLRASGQLRSYASETTMTTTAGGESQQIRLAMQVVNEPLLIHQTMTMDTPQGEQQIEQYLTEAFIYMKAGDNWLKMASDTAGDLIDAYSNPEQQLEQFKSLVDQFQLREQDGDYVLEASISGDAVKQLAQTMLNQSGGSEVTGAIMDGMNISEFRIKSTIDKSTYFQKTSDVTLVMEMEAEGQREKVEIEMINTMSNHNGIGELTIPQEALDAQDLGQLGAM